jgi:maleylpyruvate isomerase
VSELPPIPRVDLTRVADAQRRFTATITTLTDDEARRATALPGWTVAHLLTHVARNADSHRRRADAAARDETIDQYPGGFSGRTAEIEAGANRRAVELIEDVVHSAALMQAVWEQIPGPKWLNRTRDVGGRERPLNALPGRRWQELEVHVVDLGLGPTYRDWPDEFVEVWLPRLRADLPSRLAEPAELPTNLDQREELAWLYGRLTRPDLPVVVPWL